MNRKAVILLAVIFLAFTVGSAHCFEEVLPEGVERFGASALWDNDSNMQVDPSANAGQNSCIAIIDTGVFYEEINQSYNLHHEDLQENIWVEFGNGKGGKGYR